MPLTRASRFEARAAFVLAFLAGCVDAVGFSHLGGIFVSFMSGNTTRLGLHIAAGEWGAAAAISGIIAGFVVGAAAGTMAGTVGPRWRRATLVGIEAAVLVLAVVLGETAWREGAAMAMAFAMGLENEVFVDAAGGGRISLTFVSGTLVKVGEALGRIATGGAPQAWSRSLVLWASLLAGVVTGGLSYARVGLWTLLGVSLVFVVSAMIFLKIDGGEADRQRTPAG